MRGAIDLGDAAYAGRRISREAAFADAAAAEEDSDGDLLAEKSSDDEQPDRSVFHPAFIFTGCYWRSDVNLTSFHRACSKSM